MKAILAIDSFKGCLTSGEANRAAAEGIRAEKLDAACEMLTVSDGGEGWVNACSAAAGGHLVSVEVRDPLSRPVRARYLIHGDTAYIEVAQACGLSLLTPEERNPLQASSYGVGQLVADAVGRGCKHLVVGLGGSATSDAGKGMMQALKDAFGRRVWWRQAEQLQGVRVTLATDVQNPLLGPAGAAHVFAPQKGATPEMVEELERRAAAFSEEAAQHFLDAAVEHVPVSLLTLDFVEEVLSHHVDCAGRPGAGAAGGLGYALLEYFQAEVCSGIDLLLDLLHFNDLLADADFVVTGEGSADRQTLMGKLPFGILRRVHEVADIPVHLMAGSISDADDLLAAGFTTVTAVTPPAMPLSEALQPDVAARLIRQSAQKMCTRWP